MASPSSSSGCRPKFARKYDVFISFRGETRNNFTSHLHAALNQAFIVAFRDDKSLEKGDEIAPSLIQAIEDSNIFVVVFSEDYASSRWCLDELTQIIQYGKDEGRHVIPIFYKVEPTNLRHISGTYKDAFEEHEKNHHHDKVRRWKAVLSEAADLCGWHCQSSTDESNLIKQIVADVTTKLKRIYNCQGALKDIIGIDEMIKPIENLLENFHKVGIWGIGGLGKTTMAKAVFFNLSTSYADSCFLENVREETEKKGLKHVRDSLISGLLRRDIQSNPSICLTDISYVTQSLSRKKALVVLDDVDSPQQLLELQDNICNILGEGSKFIITTRDKQVLRASGCEIHDAKGLSYDNSRRLFIGKAFGSDHPEYGYEQLIKGFVDYTQHNPLALKVLGSLVRSVNKKAWVGLLSKLRAGNPNGEVQRVLRMSYDGLDNVAQQIFLDIACFLKGESEEFVGQLLGSYDFYPTVGMQTLKDKALIVTTSGNVEMHDLIQEMGLQIVREESMKQPGKRSRLWDPNDIDDVLENCEGEKEVEGIMLDISRLTRPIKLTAKTFNKMKSIRFLKFYSFRSHRMSITTGELESISSKIRYFHWEGYPWKSLPSKFFAQYLVELNMGHSSIQTLWEGFQDLANLRRLNLQDCHYLRELPDFSKACRLESVCLRGCHRLCYVHASLLSLHSLISLDVSNCFALESLKGGIHLKSLKEVKVFGCNNLKEFSVSSEELTSLDLYSTGIEDLGPSVRHCSKLEKLHLYKSKLKNLPIIIEVLSCLTSLKELRISFHNNIDNVGPYALVDYFQNLWHNVEINLEVLFDALPPLETLYLEDWPHLTKLPNSIRHLSGLQCLSLEGCTALRSLPEFPLSLRILIARNCSSLETVHTSTFSSTSHNYGEKIFSFVNCKKLDFDTIKQAKRLLERAAREMEDATVCYASTSCRGSVPQWFDDSATSVLNFFYWATSKRIVGFVYWAIVPNFGRKEVCLGPSVSLSFEYEGSCVIGTYNSEVKLEAGNVIVRSDPKLSESLLKKLAEAKRIDQMCWLNFYFFGHGRCYSSERCGIYPIYGPED